MPVALAVTVNESYETRLTHLRSGIRCLSSTREMAIGAG